MFCLLHAVLMELEPASVTSLILKKLGYTDTLRITNHEFHLDNKQINVCSFCGCESHGMTNTCDSH